MSGRKIQSITPIYQGFGYYPARRNVCRLKTIKRQKIYDIRLWGYRARNER